METPNDYSVHQAIHFSDRAAILHVLAAVYQEEKGWVPDLMSMFPLEELESKACIWFLVRHGEKPIGAVRVLYELPTALYRTYQFDLVNPSFDLAGFIHGNAVAEIGRFAVLPDYRQRFVTAALLMKAAVSNTIRRGFTHFITDVFENEATSPLQFHTRVLGFEPVATHDFGELHCSNRRITLMLDIPRSLRRFQKRGTWLFRFICKGFSETQLQAYFNRELIAQSA